MALPDLNHIIISSGLRIRVVLAIGLSRGLDVLLDSSYNLITDQLKRLYSPLCLSWRLKGMDYRLFLYDFVDLLDPLDNGFIADSVSSKVEGLASLEFEFTVLKQVDLA